MKWNRPQKRISRSEAILTLIALLFVGSIFTFGMQYWNKPVERADAIPLSAAFESYDVQRSRRSSKSIRLFFQDTDTGAEIDSCCVTDALTDLLDAIPAGTEVSVLLHPHSGTVLEMTAEDRTILSFDEAQRKLSGEAAVFQYLGWFLYAYAAFIGVKLIRGWEKGYISL